MASDLKSVSREDKKVEETEGRRKQDIEIWQMKPFSYCYDKSRLRKEEQIEIYTAREGGHAEVDERVEDRKGERKAQQNRTESLKEWKRGGKRGGDEGGVAWQRMTGWIRCRERIVRGHISNLFTHETWDTWLCQSASASHFNCPLYSC